MDPANHHHSHNNYDFSPASNFSLDGYFGDSQNPTLSPSGGINYQ